MKRWTQEQTEQLVALAGKVPAPQIAEIVGRSLEAVYNKVNVLGIHNKPWTPPPSHPWRRPLNETQAVKTVQRAAKKGRKGKSNA